MKNFVLILAALALTACSPASLTSEVAAPAADSIVGGEKVARLSAVGRSTVALYEQDIGYICSGTLVAKNLILTAAHCVDPKSKNLLAVFKTEIKNAKKADLRKVTHGAVHPSYSSEMKAKDLGDIAIVRFEGSLPLGYEVAPILFDAQAVQKNSRTIVAGYGLNWTTLISKGAGVLRTTKLDIDNPTYSQTEAMLGQSVRRGICSGDSGGPAYLDIGGRLHVWGVASRGDSLPLFFVPKCMLFSIFTRVDAYQDWIMKTMTALESIR